MILGDRVINNELFIFKYFHYKFIFVIIVCRDCENFEHDCSTNYALEMFSNMNFGLHELLYDNRFLKYIEPKLFSSKFTLNPNLLDKF